MHEKDTMISAWITERAGLIEQMNMPLSELVKGFYGGPPSIPAKAGYTLYYFLGLKKKDAVMLLDCYQRQIDIAQLPYHRRPANSIN